MKKDENRQPREGSKTEEIFNRFVAGWEPTRAEIIEAYAEGKNKRDSTIEVATVLSAGRKWLKRNGKVLGFVDGRHKILDETNCSEGMKKKFNRAMPHIQGPQEDLIILLEEHYTNNGVRAKLEDIERDLMGTLMALNSKMQDLNKTHTDV